MVSPSARSDRRRLAVALVVASFVVSTLVPVLGKSPVGDLSGIHTDHMRHAFAAWVFLHKGLDLYRRPFGEVAADVAYRHPIITWEAVPYAYPPGVFALFLPVTLLGQVLPLSEQGFARLCMLYVILLTHLAFGAVLLELDTLSGAGRSLVALVSWLYLVRAGLQGFYDSVWVGLGAMAIRELARERPIQSLRWFALAALAHYRAAPLVALGGIAVLETIRGRAPREWPWRDLIIVGVACVLSVGTFALMHPHFETFRQTAPLIVRTDASALWIVVGASVVAFVSSLALADGAVAGTVAVTLGLALVDTGYWWHALVLLAAPLAVGAWRPGRSALLARVVLVAWLVCLQRYAWAGRPTDLFRDVATFLALMKG
ncbi:MAG TPA: hypothetical protein VGW35_23875 [Methylomirabilota bacterium]|nr:hypothetical protein [Methylomirabilota bacterium]